MGHGFFQQAAAELGVQIGGAILVLAPILWATLRNRPQTINRQIDALARKSRDQRLVAARTVHTD